MEYQRENIHETPNSRPAHHIVRKGGRHLPDNRSQLSIQKKSYAEEKLSNNHETIQRVQKSDLSSADWKKVNSETFKEFAKKHYAPSGPLYDVWLENRRVDAILKYIAEFNALMPATSSASTHSETVPTSSSTHSSSSTAKGIERRDAEEEMKVADQREGDEREEHLGGGGLLPEHGLARAAAASSKEHSSHDERVAKARSRQRHLTHVSDFSKGTYEETDPKTYSEARDIFQQNTAQYHEILNEKQAKIAGFSGIVNFGTNKTIQDTAGVAAKPHSITAYGGTELTWANNQKMLGLLGSDSALGKKASTVRPGVNNANISVARLEIALSQHELIYFHLNQFSQPMIEALKRDDETFTVGGKFKPVLSVTGQEFIHIYKNWDRFRESVIFLRNLAPVHPPF